MSRSIKAGEAFLELNVKNNLQKGLRRASRTLDNFSRQLIRVGAIGAGVGASLALAFAPFVKEAGDFQETLSRFETLFGKNKVAAKDFAETLVDNFGKSRKEVMDMMSSFQGFLSNTLDPAQALKMTKLLTEAATDFASAMNLTDEDAFSKILAGMSGESEPLKRYGIMMTAGATNSMLERMGIDPNTATEVDKVMARWEILNESLADTKVWGDLNRTADSFNNQLKALQGTWQNVKADLGKPLLELLAGIAAGLRPVIERVAKWVKENPELVQQIAVLVALGTAAAGAFLALGIAGFVLNNTLVLLGAALGGTIAKLAIVHGALAAIPVVINKLYKSVVWLGNRIVSLSIGFSYVQKTGSAMMRVLAGITASMSKLAVNASTAVVSLIRNTVQFSKFAGVLKNSYKALQPVLGSINSLRVVGSGAAKSLLRLVPALQKIGNFASASGSGISFSKIFSGWIRGTRALGQGLLKLGPAFRTAFSTVSGLVNLFGKGVSNIAKFVSGLKLAKAGGAVVASVFSKTNVVLFLLFEALQFILSILPSVIKAFTDFGKTVLNVGVDAFGGLINFLKGGDFKKAMEILVAGAKVVWFAFVKALKEVWADVTAYFPNRLDDARTWVAKALFYTYNVFQNFWNELVAGFQTVIAFFKFGWNLIAEYAKSTFSGDFDYGKAFQKASDSLQKELIEIDNSLASQDKERQKRLKDGLELIEEENKRKQENRQADTKHEDEMIKRYNERVKQLRKESEESENRKKIEEDIDKIKKKETPEFDFKKIDTPKIGEAITAPEPEAGSRGIFSAAALQSLRGPQELVQKEIEKNTRDSADELKKMNKNMARLNNTRFA